MRLRDWVLARLRIAAAAVVGCAVCAAIVTVVASPATATAKRQINAATSAHRRAAIRDASHLLAGVVAPPGAVKQSSSTGVGPHTRLLDEAFDSAVARARWTVPENFSSVLSFVTAHLPTGSRPDGTFSGSNPTLLGFTRKWPPVDGVIGDRLLQIQVTAVGSNQTLLSAVAQSQWIVARSESERIPAGVREINVTSGMPGKHPFLSRAVTDREHVRALIKLFDSLPVVQPGVINCPTELADQPVVTVTFKRASTSRPAARAQVSSAANLPWPAATAGWACFAVDFSVLGRRQPALSGNVIGPLQRMLGVNLAKPHR